MAKSLRYAGQCPAHCTSVSTSLRQVLDIIRQMRSGCTVCWTSSGKCVLGPQFAGHHPANCSLGPDFAGHHPANCSLGQEFAGCHPANFPLVESSLDIIRQL